MTRKESKKGENWKKRRIVCLPKNGLMRKKVGNPRQGHYRGKAKWFKWAVREVGTCM